MMPFMLLEDVSTTTHQPPVPGVTTTSGGGGGVWVGCLGNSENGNLCEIILPACAN